MCGEACPERFKDQWTEWQPECTRLHQLFPCGFWRLWPCTGDLQTCGWGSDWQEANQYRNHWKHGGQRLRLHERTNRAFPHTWFPGLDGRFRKRLFLPGRASEHSVWPDQIRHGLHETTRWRRRWKNHPYRDDEDGDFSWDWYDLWGCGNREPGTLPAGNCLFKTSGILFFEAYASSPDNGEVYRRDTGWFWRPESVCILRRFGKCQSLWLVLPCKSGRQCHKEYLCYSAYWHYGGQKQRWRSKICPQQSGFPRIYESCFRVRPVWSGNGVHRSKGRSRSFLYEGCRTMPE